jgi:hypothetical protein
MLLQRRQSVYSIFLNLEKGAFAVDDIVSFWLLGVRLWHQFTCRLSYGHTRLSVTENRAIVPPFLRRNQLLSSFHSISRTRPRPSYSAKLTVPKLPVSRPVKWTTEAPQALSYCKKAFPNCALLAHPNDETPIAIVEVASDFAMGAALPKLMKNNVQPSRFLSQKL